MLARVPYRAETQRDAKPPVSLKPATGQDGDRVVPWKATLHPLPMDQPVWSGFVAIR